MEICFIMFDENIKQEIVRRITWNLRAKDKLSISFFILALILSISLMGQQVPLDNQYFIHPYSYNPAWAGATTPYTNLFLLHKSQWTGIPGAPMTTRLMADGPIPGNRIGLGLQFVRDATDLLTNQGLYAAYSYHVFPSGTTPLNFGLSLGVLENHIDFSKAVVNDPGDEALFGYTEKRFALDGAFGALFRWKGLDINVAVPQIMANSLKYETSANRATYQLARHWIFGAGYDFLVSSAKGIHIQPSMVTRLSGSAPVQYDFNAIGIWDEKGWVGLSYKSNYALALNAGMQIHKHFRIGYSYDMVLNNLQPFAGISHEVLLGYCFDLSGKKSEDRLRELENSQDSITAWVGELEKKVLLHDTLLLEHAGGRGEMFEDLVKRADKAVKEKDYVNTLNLYKQARAIKPYDPYVNKMIEDLEKILDASYEDAIAKSNRAFEQGKYEKALQGYEDALRLKPGEMYPKESISKIRGLLDAASKDVKVEYAEDLVDESGKRMPKGIYVVVGAFKSDKLAKSWKDQHNARMMFNNKVKFYEVYTHYAQDMDEARQLLIKARKDITPDAWILKLL